MTGKRKNTVADNPLVRSRVAVVWSDLITQGRIQGAKTVADAYNARFEDKEPSSTINDRTARKVIIDLLKTGEIEIRYKRFGLEPEINENLSVILERIWPEAVKKFVVVDIPAMTRMKTADTYRALNEVSYPHIKAALKSYISNPDSNRTVGWGSGYTAFHLADLVSQDPEMKSILSNAEIYPLTASIYRPEIHAKLLTEGAMAAQHLPGAPEVFDAQYNAQVIQKFSGCIVEDVPGPIFNMDRDKKNSADCENWIQSAEFALKSVKKKYGYDEEVIQTTLQNSTSEFNIVGAGAFSKNHKIFDIIRGFGLNEDTYPIPSEILSKLNRLADITEEIKRLTKNDFDEELDGWRDNSKPRYCTQNSSPLLRKIKQYDYER